MLGKTNMLLHLKGECTSRFFFFLTDLLYKTVHNLDTFILNQAGTLHA